MTIELNPKTISAARKRKAAGATWKYLAAHYDVSVDCLRRNLDPDYVSKRRAVSKAHRTKYYLGSTENPDARCGYVVAHHPPPAEVLFERERAYAQPQSITAHLLGDPPAGRSALDRMGRQ